MTTIFLDTNAMMKLIELGGPQVQLELTQAAVANVARRTFAKYLPAELRRVIDKEVVAARQALVSEAVIRTMIEERLDVLRRANMVSASKDPKVREEAIKVVDELFGAFIRGIVEEKTGTLEEFTATKTNEVVERLGKRIAGTVEHDASIRVNELVKERVAAILTNLQAA